MPTLTNLLLAINALGVDNVLSDVNDVTPQQVPPTFNPPAGTYSEAQSVDITSEGVNVDGFYYTVDNSSPTKDSSLYTGPLSIGATKTLKAIAVNQDVRVRASNIASGDYIINVAPVQSFLLLAATTITNTGLSTVTGGDIGLFPGVSVTGFPPGVLSAPGVLHINDALAQQAQSDLVASYATLVGLPSDGPLSADLSGQTYTPGVYTQATSVLISAGSVTLDALGDTNAIFVFQIGTTLTLASGTSVDLINGADPSKVFFAIGTSATIGTSAKVRGGLIAQVSVTLNAGAEVTGVGVAAMTGAITLDGNTIIKP